MATSNSQNATARKPVDVEHADVNSGSGKSAPPLATRSPYAACDPDVIEVEPLPPPAKDSWNLHLCLGCRRGMTTPNRRCYDCRRKRTNQQKRASDVRRRRAGQRLLPEFGKAEDLVLPAGESAFVYRLWNASGECLYVGKTAQPHPLIRVMKHRRAPWWDEVARADYVPVLDGSLEVAEAFQIFELQPKYNVVRPAYAAVMSQPGWSELTWDQHETARTDPLVSPIPNSSKAGTDCSDA
jgi:hypothetical protein